ncbi:unnamed protein product [Didymodactylos carnosus]|uniref:G-protein coupled receptors family 1 profile domain-containing protein n=2 Tax=Didymodactylos carnosus TaxID=1234261 RepID=A0A814RDU2_9BILA|nr:unnamed protein product [Didymodactylos carnosus]CAF3896371.1 unnamed protein product [Didymodactylos carnosus]
MFSDIQYVLSYAMGPPLLMAVFGMLTISNVGKIRRHIVPSQGVPNIKIRKKDIQLMIMLFCQVTLILIFTSPFGIQKLYDTFTLNNVKTSLKVAQDNFATQFIRLVSYIEHVFGFYFYTLSSRTFRNEFLRLIDICLRFIYGAEHRNFAMGNTMMSQTNNNTINEQQKRYLTAFSAT